MTTAAEIGNAAIREAVQAGLAECTQAQRDLFDRIYPGLPDSQLAEAYDLVQRTLRKSQASRPLVVGDRLRRLPDGRRFEITFINHSAPVPVFSAKPTDGKWSHWGGALSKLRQGETFIMDGA